MSFVNLGSRVILFLVYVAYCVGKATPQDKVMDLITSSQEGVVPTLRIRTGGKRGGTALGVIVTLRTTGLECTFRNPYGDSDKGRNYDVVLTDSSGHIVRRLVEHSKATNALVSNEVKIEAGGVVGRCHWLDPDAVFDADQHKGVSNPKLASGKYQVVLRVKSSAFVRSGQDDRVTSRDQYECRSNPVDVFVNELGVWASAMEDAEQFKMFPEFTPCEAEYSVDTSRQLTVVTQVVSPATDEYVKPWLDGWMDDSTGPLHVTIDSISGERVARFPHDWDGSGMIRELSDSVRVPEDGVIGGTRLLIQLKPGAYVVHSTFDQSYLRSGCFDSEGRLKQLPFWKVLYSSPPVVIRVRGTEGGVAPLMEPPPLNKE